MDEKEVKKVNVEDEDKLNTYKGKFIDSLKRNNRKIKTDRAISITEDTQLLYKRAVEDLDIKIKKMKRDQKNSLDLSPSDSRSLTPAKDFDSDGFVEDDINLAIKIKQSELSLEVAKKRYEELFGGE